MKKNKKLLRCFYCGIETYQHRLTDGERPHPQMRTKDHLHPRAKGGGNNCMGNTVVCCFKCNQEKGDKTYLEFLQSKGLIDESRKVKRHG